MRLIAAAVLTITLTIGPDVTAQAQPQPPICGGWRFDLTDPAHRAVRGPHLVACVFNFLGIPEQIPMAQYVANRESHYQPDAYNASGCGGIYQHMVRYWRGRAHAYLPLWRFPNRDAASWSNALANVWVTGRMVKASGWGPWAL